MKLSLVLRFFSAKELNFISLFTAPIHRFFHLLLILFHANKLLLNFLYSSSILFMFCLQAAKVVEIYFCNIVFEE